MNIRDHFKPQLDVATPLTLAQIDEMRAGRRARLDDEQYEQALKAARLDTDELVGKCMLYYMLQAVDDQPNREPDSTVIKLLWIFDDALEQLNGLKFVRMASNIPVFEDNQ